MHSREERRFRRLRQLLVEGAGIRITRTEEAPLYHWTDPVPDELCQASHQLVGLLISSMTEVLHREPVDYVIVFDNGGNSRRFGELLADALGGLWNQDVGLLIVRRVQRKKHGRTWRFWMRHGDKTHRLRTEQELDAHVRQKRALCFVDVLEQDRKILHVAKSARHKRNRVDIVGVACLVKRDDGLRSTHIPEVVGVELPLYFLFDCHVKPRRTGPAVKPEKASAEEVFASEPERPGVLARLLRLRKRRWRQASGI